MPYYHLYIEWKDWRTSFLKSNSKIDLRIEQLVQFVDPIKNGSPIFLDGWRIDANDVWHFEIWETAEREQGKSESSWDWIHSHGKNVTNDFITGLPSRPSLHKTTLKEKMAIGNISNFFGIRSGSMSFDKLLKSYGLENIPEGNKTERLSNTLWYLYQENRTGLISFLNMLILRHRLDNGDFEELNSYLIHLGFQIDNRKIIEIPVEEDFFSFFVESLKHPESQPAAEGIGDGAIITLSEKIMSMESDFVLVDYGCGEGRLVYGLNCLDGRVLSHLTYIGVDKNTECLEKISKTIKNLDFDKKIKNYELMTPKQFFGEEEKGRETDFVFMINVLHEIPLSDLPGILHRIERKSKVGGNMVIHEMRELVKGELGFVSWEEEDFLEVFKDTTFRVHLHPYETKRSIPLINAHLTKVMEEPKGIGIRDSHALLYYNCTHMYEKKLERVNQQLEAIKKKGNKPRKYAYLLVLKDNLETQIRANPEFVTHTW
jgi:hypothetical protein